MKQLLRPRPIPPALRVPVALLGAVQLVLFIVARRDLRRRPDELLRGRRGWWRAALLVNTIGPVAYLRLGRRDAA